MLHLRFWVLFRVNFTATGVFTAIMSQFGLNRVRYTSCCNNFVCLKSWLICSRYFHFRRRSRTCMAVVQLQFQKDVDDPLKPLRDDISDGYFGMFKVERQLDLNPSMFDPLTIFGLFTRNILDINQLYIWRSVSFLHIKLIAKQVSKQRLLKH